MGQILKWPTGCRAWAVGLMLACILPVAAQGQGSRRIEGGAWRSGDLRAGALPRRPTEAAPDSPQFSREALLENGSVRGELTRGDRVDELGRLVDRYTFTAEVGDRIIVDMASLEFDALLMLTLPDGRSLEFDDFGGGRNPRIDIEAELSGRYLLTATSYGSLVTGRYTLDVELGDGDTAPAAPHSAAVAEGRRLLGVFVGIADYDGEAEDLPRSDQDAKVLYDIFTRQFGMERADSALLLNEDATVENVMEAVERIGRRAQPDDMLIFFYSGHGGQMMGPADAKDPDGVHETLFVRGGEIRDDDFAEAINRSEAGLCLVVLDSCLSGGFAKDVVSAPGRMGIFSSEEDVLSAVPDRIDAGGYLSQFFADAISDFRDVADVNGNRQLTAFELSDYLHERYRNDVRPSEAPPKGGDGYVDIRENLRYQRLVIDRSGIRHDQVLFRW